MVTQNMLRKHVGKYVFSEKNVSFVTALDLNKCLTQIKYPRSPRACAPSSKLPYNLYVLGDPEVTANLHCDFAYLYWEGCVICSIYLR